MVQIAELLLNNYRLIIPFAAENSSA